MNRTAKKATEITFFIKERNIQIDILPDIEILSKINNKDIFNALYMGSNIANLIETCKNNNIKYYTYENNVIFIVNTPDIDRYYHIFKKNNIYDVDDCLVYN